MTILQMVLLAVIVLAITEIAVAIYIVYKPKTIINKYREIADQSAHDVARMTEEITYQRALTEMLGTIFSDLINIQPGTIDSEIRIFRIANIARILQTKGIDQKTMNLQVREAIHASPDDLLKTVQIFINRYAVHDSNLHAAVFDSARTVKHNIPRELTIPASINYSEDAIQTADVKPVGMEVGATVDLSGIECYVEHIDWNTQVAVVSIEQDNYKLFTIPDSCRFSDSMLAEECNKMDDNIPLDLKGVIMNSHSGESRCRIFVPSIALAKKIHSHSSTHHPMWALDDNYQLHSVAYNGTVSSIQCPHFGVFRPCMLINLIAYGEYYDYIMRKEVRCS